MNVRIFKTGNISVESGKTGCAVVSPKRGGKLLWWDRVTSISSIKWACRDYVDNPSASFNNGNYN